MNKKGSGKLSKKQLTTRYSDAGRSKNGTAEKEYNKMFAGSEKWKTFDRMNNDSTVAALISAVELVATSTIYSVAQGEGSEADAAFIQDVLIDKNNLGWSTFLKHIIKSLSYGHSLFEMYFDQEDGIRVPRFTYIKPASIKQRVQENGEAGITQIEMGNGYRHKLISIPAHKLVLFTHDSEGEDDYLGRGLFRKIGRPRYYKDRLQTYQAVDLERGATPIPKVTMPQGTDEDIKQSHIDAARDMKTQENPVVLKEIDEDGAVILDYDVLEGKANKQDMSPTIMTYKQEIFDAYHAQFLYLGSSEKGSYGMATNSTQFFTMAVESLVKNILEVINQYVVPKIIAINHGTRAAYPTVEYSAVGFTDVSSFAELIEKLAKSGNLTPNYDTEVHIRKIMKLPEISEEEYDKQQAQRSESVTGKSEQEPKDSKKASKDDKDKKGTDLKASCCKTSKDHLFSSFDHSQVLQFQNIDVEKPAVSDTPVFREYTKPDKREMSFAEKKVKAKSITKAIDKAEALLEAEYLLIAEEQIAEIAEQAKALVNKNNLKAATALKLKKNGKLRNTILGAYKPMFEKGKSDVAEELGLSIPTTAKGMHGVISMQSEVMAAAHKAKMEGIANTFIAEEVRKKGGIVSLDGKKVSVDLSKRLQLEYGKSLNTIKTVAVMGGMNTGRSSTLDKYADKIEMVLYSAILDRRTTPRCQDLDGLTVKMGSDDYETYMPPQHYLCRSIYVAIMKTDEMKPKLTGVNRKKIRPKTQRVQTEKDLTK